MNKEQYINTGFFQSGLSFEEYQKCECFKCKEQDCPHRECYRRYPREVGGLALCPNLNK